MVIHFKQEIRTEIIIVLYYVEFHHKATKKCASPNSSLSFIRSRRQLQRVPTKRKTSAVALTDE